MNRKQLIKAYRELHGGAQFNGYTLMSYQADVWEFLRGLGARTVLDVGSGKGEAWKKWKGALGVDVYCYDPGVPELSALPAPHLKYDAVVCCDVLEHLLEPDVDSLIALLFQHARRGVWVSTCSRPAKKCFPGTDVNMHTCLLPYKEWNRRLQVANVNGVSLRHVDTP